MVHDKAHKVIYNDFMLLDDNFDDKVFKGFTYTGNPIKILFVMQMMCVRGRMRIRVNLRWWSRQTTYCLSLLVR